MLIDWIFPKKRHRRNKLPFNPERMLKKIERVLTTEKLYLRQDITIEKLARHVGTNRTYIGMAVKSCGVSFHDYINSFRIKYLAENAEKFLEAKNTVDEIAEQCGFATARTMNRYLKKTGRNTVTDYLRCGCDGEAID